MARTELLVARQALFQFRQRPAGDVRWLGSKAPPRDPSATYAAPHCPLSRPLSLAASQGKRPVPFGGLEDARPTLHPIQPMLSMLCSACSLRQNLQALRPWTCTYQHQTGGPPASSSLITALASAAFCPVFSVPSGVFYPLLTSTIVILYRIGSTPSRYSSQLQRAATTQSYRAT